jgi:hypothetical protein
MPHVLNKPTSAHNTPNHWPVSHTCFFTVDLPQYTSKEQLRDKLLLAINSPDGQTFGVG